MGTRLVLAKGSRPLLKGRGEDAKDKMTAMETYWVPGVNRLRDYGCWAFAEFTDVYEIESAFADSVRQLIANPP